MKANKDKGTGVGFSNDENRGVINPLEDQRRSALEHYEEASSAITHWSSFVVAAIKEYNPKELLTALLSPALHNQCNENIKYCYPKKWKGKVPLKVKLLKDVKPDLPFLSFHSVTLRKGEIYYVWVNSYGAVAAIFKNKEQLGLKPNEFKVIEWHK